MKAAGKNIRLLTALTLTLGPLVVAACASDEPRMISTTERTTTKFDDGSTQSTSTTRTVTHE